MPDSKLYSKVKIARRASIQDNQPVHSYTTTSPPILDDAPSKSEAAPTQTEDPPTEDSVSEKDWAPSDTEDENWGSKVGNRNLSLYS